MESKLMIDFDSKKIWNVESLRQLIPMIQVVNFLHLGMFQFLKNNIS